MIYTLNLFPYWYAQFHCFALHLAYLYYTHTQKKLCWGGNFFLIAISSVIIFFFNQKLKTPSYGTFLERTSEGFFALLLFIFSLHVIFVPSFYCCSLFVVFLHFISRLLYHVTGTPPWLLRPVKAFTSSELYLIIFDRLFFLIYRKCCEFEWAFLTLSSFIDILICVYQGFPGSRQFFLEVCSASYWSSKDRSIPSACLIHSNPQSLYILNLYLYMSTLQKFYLWWKLWWKNINIFYGSALSLNPLDKIRLSSRSATTLFSIHENTKQEQH